MSQAILGSPSRKTTTIVAGLPPLLVAIADAFSQALATIRTRRVVAALSADQARDAGIERAELFGDRPVIEVPARLMTSLMLMR